MPIEQVKVTSSVRITCENVEIDAHWNFFKSVEDAIKYLPTLRRLPNHSYGFVKVQKEFWEHTLDNRSKSL